MYSCEHLCAATQWMRCGGRRSIARTFFFICTSTVSAAIHRIHCSHTAVSGGFAPTHAQYCEKHRIPRDPVRRQSVRCAPQLRLTHSTSGTSALLRACAHNALDGEARPQRGVCAKAASLSCRVAAWLLVPRVSFDGRKKTGLLRTKLKRGERRRSTETCAVTALSSTKSVRQALG